MAATLLQKSVGKDRVTVNYLQNSDRLEIEDGQGAANCVYTFAVVGRKYNRDEPATVTPAEIIWSDAGTGERKRSDLMVVPAPILGALADCDVSLDLDRRGGDR